ncbi:tail fiber assembly protein [Escherichia coli]|uniref:tail fiber assembly protein n=1 Tax=Escherichia coli TaxID=562 RepID=UPI001AB05E24|nr:tail fiber assembly protein [Escherichia coli]MBO3239381.1 tail fiber assembly protein [Escherichia coli]HEA0721224.1 tail fiber assembly protein [Escherichia coli]
MSLSKKFERYIPVAPMYGNVSYSRNVDGDWYEQQKNFAEDTLKILYDDDGRISVFTRDVSQLPDPAGFYIAELSVTTVDTDKQRFIDGKLVEHQKSPGELIAEADSLKLSLRAKADSEIEWRRYAVDKGIATVEESAALDAWNLYRVQLMRVDTSKPEWPEKPA